MIIIVLKFCQHLKSGTVHVPAEFDDDVFLQYWVFIVETHKEI